MKTGAERVPWICGLIMPEHQQVHNNECSKRARDSVAPESLCVAWLNDGVAPCECWNGVKLQWMTTGMQQQQQQSACGPTARCARFHGYTTA